MPEVRILTEAELRQCVAVDDQAIAVVEKAFAALAGGGVVMPPILRLDIAEYNGEVDVKTAYVPGFDSFAMKMSPGFFDNPKIGLPSTSGLMVLLSARTGQVEAVLLDNGYLTDVRTAAAGGVAAKYLARNDAGNVGVIGCGAQARLQVEALARVRAISSLTVWGRDAAKARAYAEDMGGRLGVEVAVAPSPEALVRDNDIVITTTPATEPLVEADWLHPGLHITAMGSDAEHKNELAPGVLAAADRYVCDRRSQVERLGELHHALRQGAVGDDFAVTEIGDVITGAAPGRESDAQITVCDLTGTGVQDTAIARFAFQAALDKGFGSVIEA